MSETEILHVENVSKYFGGLAAVNNCSLRIKKGSITGIIGPNGSGKTTLFNLIAGNFKSTKGSVIFNYENITNIPSYQLVSGDIIQVRDKSKKMELFQDSMRSVQGDNPKPLP